MGSANCPLRSADRDRAPAAAGSSGYSAGLLQHLIGAQVELGRGRARRHVVLQICRSLGSSAATTERTRCAGPDRPATETRRAVWRAACDHSISPPGTPTNCVVTRIASPARSRRTGHHQIDVRLRGDAREVDLVAGESCSACCRAHTKRAQPARELAIASGRLNPRKSVSGSGRSTRKGSTINHVIVRARGTASTSPSVRQTLSSSAAFDADAGRSSDFSPASAARSGSPTRWCGSCQERPAFREAWRAARQGSCCRQTPGCRRAFCTASRPSQTDRCARRACGR